MEGWRNLRMIIKKTKTVTDAVDIQRTITLFKLGCLAKIIV